jgi:putative ABC transport system substrate-binding protein
MIVLFDALREVRFWHANPNGFCAWVRFGGRERNLVERKVDIIATTGPLPIEAAKRATDTIPIVIIARDRADRLVANIARPGGNITGMACISSDLAAKRLQLLQEIIPKLSHVAVL